MKLYLWFIIVMIGLLYTWGVRVWNYNGLNKWVYIDYRWHSIGVEYVSYHIEHATDWYIDWEPNTLDVEIS